MADGATHYKWYKLGIIPSLTVGLLFSLLLGDPVFFFVLYTVNYALGSVVEPDLDQISVTSSEGRFMRFTKKIGFVIGIFGAIWVGWWTIYAYVIGGHFAKTGRKRNPKSHGFEIGTIGRIVWFNLPFAAIIAGVCWYYGWKDWYYQIYGDIWMKPYFLSQFLALSFSDGIHLFLDTEFAKGRFYTPVEYSHGKR